MRVAARLGTALTLLDFRADGCARIGAPTDSVPARNHAAGRAPAKTIHGEHGDVEGPLQFSRLAGEDICFLLLRSPLAPPQPLEPEFSV